MSYTDGNCMHCGSCLQGCPTNAGKNTGNTWIADTWARGLLELRADSPVDRVVIEGGRATGVEVGRRRAQSAPTRSSSPAAR